MVRRHIKTGDLAFHYCYVPEGQLLTKTRLIRAAGLRWPAEEDFEFAKDCFGLDQCQARLYTAIARHLVLVMAALAICAATAALLRDRTDTQAPPPARPDEPPPADPGMIPLTVPEIKRLLAAILRHARPHGHAEHWLDWRRRHQARSRWYHKRARLARDAEIALVSWQLAAAVLGEYAVKRIRTSSTPTGPPPPVVLPAGRLMLAVVRGWLLPGDLRERQLRDRVRLDVQPPVLDVARLRLRLDPQLSMISRPPTASCTSTASAASSCAPPSSASTDGSNPLPGCYGAAHADVSAGSQGARM